MSRNHIPTEAVFEIAEGRHPSTFEIEHLRLCEDCREVLRVVAQQESGSEQTRTRKGTAGHVSVARLFRFAKGTDLEDKELQHLFGCEQCAGVLWICRSENSLIPVIQIMKEKKLRIE